MHASVAHTHTHRQLEQSGDTTHTNAYFIIFIYIDVGVAVAVAVQPRPAPFVLFTTGIFASLLLLPVIIVSFVFVSCLLPSFSFHTHIFVLFATSLSLSCCLCYSHCTRASLSLPLPLPLCVRACVCLRVFPPDFCCLFLLTSSSSPHHPLRLRRSRFTRSLVGYKFLKFFSSYFFFTHRRTLFQREKRVFPDVRQAGSACMLLLACLQLGMRVPLEFEKSNENKTGTHSLSISLMWIQFVDDIVKVVCVLWSERGVCTMLFGVSQEKLNSSNNNNNYKALNVQ